MSELERAKDRIAELERALGLTSELPLRELLRPEKWHRDCEPLIGLLLARNFVPREAAYVALFGERPEGRQPEIKIVDVLMVWVRRALQPYQITVTTSWGRGWFMTNDNKARLRQLIARLKAEGR